MRQEGEEGKEESPDKMSEGQSVPGTAKKSDG